MATKTLTNKQIALHHTIAFASELHYKAQPDTPEPSFMVFGLSLNPKPATIINQMAEHLATLDGSTTEEWHKLLTTFTEDMTKVTKLRKDRGDEYLTHSGTECRGWYRVWQTFALTKDMPGHQLLNPGYFCQFDLGRDADMLLAFRDAGVIQQDHYK